MAKRIGVLIGRFQGYHYYHHEHLKRAALANDVLIVIVGSRNRRKSIKNPWSAEERISMIEANIKADPELESTRIIFREANDHPVDATWADLVRQMVSQFVNDNTTVTIYGSNKDASSFYLKMFPGWVDGTTPAIPQSFDATRLRWMWFNGFQLVHMDIRANPFIPDATQQWLKGQPFNQDLQAEWSFYRNETSKFADYPYPETLNFTCADAVLTCHEKVLMIRRKFAPGRNCLALPGGFKNNNETFLKAALRELDEEANVDIPEHILRRCLMGEQLFDSPSRSIGIPRVTMAYRFDVSRYYMDIELPATKAADDALEVEWVSIQDILYRTDTYDDHAQIVYQLTK